MKSWGKVKGMCRRLERTKPGNPAETKNIYEQKPEVVKDMQDAYDEWWDEVRPYMVNEGKKTGPNPYHVKYKEQLGNEGVPSWEKPVL